MLDNKAGEFFAINFREDGIDVGKPPLEIHIFSPFKTQCVPSALSRAVVFAASASEPEPDSLRQ